MDRPAVICRVALIVIGVTIAFTCATIGGSYVQSIQGSLHCVSCRGNFSPCIAEDCRAIPFGPERRACTMREHPGTFQAKQARCKQLGEERGFWLSDHRTQHE